MNLQMDPRYAAGYRSPCQIARRVTEGWAKDNLYCVACRSSSLMPEKANAPAIDFRCTECSRTYQLKARTAWSDRRIVDAGYAAMIRALDSDCIPNLLVMQYKPGWVVWNLLLIPSFFFTRSVIEKRKPLSSSARRAGWVGCNILLSEIAEDGKIPVVSRGVSMSQATVRSKYEQIRPFSSLNVNVRGWTLDVLRIVRCIGRTTFFLKDVYAYEETLGTAYPENRHLRPKIRQQLQVLRDLGYITFEGRGCYRLIR